MSMGGQIEFEDEKYVCRLSEEVQKIAKEDLREEEYTREQSIQQMRDWIQKHPNIKRCRTDANFLLKFLRTKKYSVPQSCELLERYMTIRQIYSQWFQNLDCENKEVLEIIDAGYIFPLLEKHKGQTVIFSVINRFDSHKYTSAHLARVHSLVTETLASDEESQVQGYAYMNDESGFSMSHVSLWSFLDIRNIARCVQHSTPMRHKEIHFINIPPVATKFLEFIISLLSDKLKSRVKIHKSMQDLCQEVDPKILPKEYGGVVPMAEMIEKFKLKMKEQRDYVLSLDDMYIEINEKECKLLSEMNEELGTGIDGSFKKLQVD